MSIDSERPEADDDAGSGLLDALVAGERASTSMQPSTSAQRQTWQRVVTSVSVGGPPPLEPSSIAGPTAVLWAPWIKIIVGVLLVGVVGFVAVDRDPDPPAPAARARAHRSAQAPQPPSVPTLQPPLAHPHPPAAPLPPAAGGTPPSPTPREVSPSKTVRPSSPQPDDPTASDLAEETRLLARARARLRADAPGDALAALAEHARRFPQGQLTEDRMVLRAQALCESGATAAGRKQASALRAAFPSSSHLARVDRRCRS